jgi:uncharacterized SAM-binding protein YcdF (DUF218 family)
MTDDGGRACHGESLGASNSAQPQSQVKVRKPSVLGRLSSVVCHKCAYALATTCLFLGLAYALRAPLLTAAANLWIVNDKLTPADAIVVLGGNLESRPFGAADLYHQGLAPRILITGVRWEPAKLLGLAQSPTELTRQILIKKGVPENALEVIGSQVKSTWDEAMALRDWSKTNTQKRRSMISTKRWCLRRLTFLPAS